MEISPDTISFNPITADHFNTCHALQADIWGKDNIIPSSIFSVANTIGGICIGAMHNNTVVGFILSIPAVWNGQQTQWSCRLAVQQDAQNKGLGTQLKMAQQARIKELGLRTLMWSFNPLDTKNAHINLNKLGAHIVGFEYDMYPVPKGSRAIVQWNIDSTAQPSSQDPETRYINTPGTENPTDSQLQAFYDEINKAVVDGFIGTTIQPLPEGAQYVFKKFK
jgi:predicted GNAT superfamily acetyltransferase